MTDSMSTKVPGAIPQRVSQQQAPSYRNGDDIHFDYESKNKKKKNKKKKNKNKSTPSVIDATLTNPDDDYPTSRILRQGPDGSVVVEGVYNEPEDYDQDDENKTNPVIDVWFHKSTPEERETLKSFWESLSKKEKQDLCKIERSEILSFLRFDKKSVMKGQPKDKQDRDTHYQSSQSCGCTNCGKRPDLIAAQLEVLCDNHLDQVNEFIQSITSLDDLPNLPNLLFERPNMINNNDDDDDDTLTPPDFEEAIKDDNLIIQDSHESSPFGGLDLLLSDANKQQINKLGRILILLNMSRVLNMEAFNKLPEDKQFTAVNEIQLVRKVLNENSHMDNNDQFMRYLQIAQLLDDSLGLSESQDSQSNESKFSFTQSLVNLTDDIFQNEGQGFIDMMEQLSGSRSSREQGGKQRQANLEHSKHLLRKTMNQMIKDAGDFKRRTQKLIDSNSTLDHAHQHDHHHHHHSHHHSHSHSHTHRGDNNHEEGDPDYDSFEEDMSDENYDDDDYDDDQDSNVDSESSLPDRFHELARIFVMQIVRIFRLRLKVAYDEKLSKDSAQLLIEELEAEESAKKEKELKKIKQREKAKEKKRLQQLAKEEERKKKEEEIKAKEEEKRRKEEQLKLDQRRRKEELQRKKEEEKRKRIEEQQLKLELQRQKEEEERLRKLKEAEEAEKRAAETKVESKTEPSKSNQSKAPIEGSEPVKQEFDPKENVGISLNSGSKEAVNNSFLDDYVDFSGVKDLVAELLIDDGESSLAIASNPLLQELYNVKSKASTPKVENQWQTSLKTSPSPHPSAVTQNFTPFSPVNTFRESLTDPFSNGPGMHSLKGLVNHPPPGLTTPGSMNGVGQLPDPSRTPGASHPPPPPPGLTNNGLNNNLTSQLGSYNMWNHSGSNSRNNSIWNPTTASSGSIWNNSSNTGSLQLGGGVPVAPNLGVTPNSNLNDNVTIHASAHQAYNMLVNQNQLEFGMIKAYSLFQATKGIVPQVNFNFNQFLGALTNSSGLVSHKFELVYDDFGTVSYIKMVDGTSPSLGQLNAGQFTSPTKLGLNPVNNLAPRTHTMTPPNLNMAPSNLNMTPPNQQVNGVGQAGISLGASHGSYPTRNLWN